MQLVRLTRCSLKSKQIHEFCWSTVWKNSESLSYLQTLNFEMKFIQFCRCDADQALDISVALLQQEVDDSVEPTVVPIDKLQQAPLRCSASPACASASSKQHAISILWCDPIRSEHVDELVDLPLADELEQHHLVKNSETPIEFEPNSELEQ